MSIFFARLPSRLCLQLGATKRSCCTNSNIKGLVLGAYSSGAENKDIELTACAKQFDEQTGGKLCASLKLAAPAGLKEGKHHVFWGLGSDFPAVAVVGLGKKDKGYNDIERICEDREATRVSAGAGAKALQSAGVSQIFVEPLGNAECAAEGAHLATWKFQEYRTKATPLPTICPHVKDEQWEHGRIKAEGQNLARKLAEKPANKMTPTIFGTTVEEIFNNSKVQVQVHDKKWIEDKKMGAFLSVAAGSCEPPKFVELTYCNGPKDAPPFILVGKGVTFDSGGISIKPSAKMDEMRADMGGAACVIGAMSAIEKLKLEVNLKCLIPLTENMPSGSATKPGDVVTAMNGKTIAVDNTDAEGRLILADALCYSGCFDPKWVLDMATLTGAIGVALGKSAAGVFANNNQLFETLEKAGANTGDRMWRMPLWKTFTKNVTDYTAYDINNVGKGAGGGSCTAAAFLKEFVPEKVDWLHLDIASVMFPGDPIPYLSGGMTGRPTRTVVEFIAMNAAKSCK